MPKNNFVEKTILKSIQRASMPKAKADKTANRKGLIHGVDSGIKMGGKEWERVQ